MTFGAIGKSFQMGMNLGQFPRRDLTRYRRPCKYDRNQENNTIPLPHLKSDHSGISILFVL